MWTREEQAMYTVIRKYNQNLGTVLSYYDFHIHLKIIPELPFGRSGPTSNQDVDRFGTRSSCRGNNRTIACPGYPGF